MRLGISEESRQVLERKMCIDVGHLLKKIASQDICQCEELICQMIDVFCGLVSDGSSRDEVNDHYNSLVPVDEGAQIVMDSLRHAFCSFASGGLRDLYTNQENESWYPKVVLLEVLEPNDIDKLEEQFFIYRGCSRRELDSGEFGQAWSTRVDVAGSFAFEHYGCQEWFDEDDRVVLWTIYGRSDVLFSDQTEGGEYEVVVKPHILSDVEVLSEGDQLAG